MASRILLVCALLLAACDVDDPRDLVHALTGEWPDAVASSTGGADVAGDDAGMTPADDTSQGSSLPSSARVVGSFAVQGTRPSGLAYDGQYLWMTDVIADSEQLVQVNADNGSRIDGAALPDGETALDLAWTGGVLYLAFDAAGVTVQRFTPTGDSFSDVTLPGSPTSLSGLGWDGERLLTWTGGTLERRDVSTGVVRYNTSFTTDGELLAVSGDRIYVVQGISSAAGSQFSVTLGIYDATRMSEAAKLGELELPVDASEVSGLAVYGSTVWILGRGYGDDAERVTQLFME